MKEGLRVVVAGFLVREPMICGISMLDTGLTTARPLVLSLNEHTTTFRAN